MASAQITVEYLYMTSTNKFGLRYDSDRIQGNGLLLEASQVKIEDAVGAIPTIFTETE